MHTREGLALSCVACGWQGDRLDAQRCPDCDGQLAPSYDADAIDGSSLRAGLEDSDSQWSVDALVPIGSDGDGVTLGEGATPLVACPTLGDELDVETFEIKDEGHNPTGTVRDRAIAVAATAAVEAGATDVALPTTGADGVAAAAYAARADLDAHVFVPTRSTHTTKAMINVHGGDMQVVEGRLPHAEDAFESAIDEEDGWTPIDPANSPLRAVGPATMGAELFASADGGVPDAVVVPTGHGEVLAGLHAVAELLVDLGILEELPEFHAVQAEGCAPIVRAFEDDEGTVEGWDSPDTISGALEVPDPAFGTHALAAVRESGGRAVAVDDEAILASACRIAAAEGLQASVAGGAAAAGAWELSNAGVFESDDAVVCCNTGAGSLDSDVLRSHLMRAG
ncbi:threonine synthase [Salinarchaeum sp. Harcht-Bsk1]|uniref:pyridoxal-phosphate dependent enzyme n=1 Tax=Salinarchaeum sp. Harcht-Bsk1 TaxID=1333523 RepID=UPI0003423445|nr:pyridoxal-phosphate dependent enzyme [Salinarchaeum sp. Harcht-Bsk1]AGN00132.1 threonine synthase [Salinarchaeum sp. Harcht-Bsk1]